MKFLLDGNFSVICLMQISYRSVVKSHLVYQFRKMFSQEIGTGSNHIREKDGLWAIVAWLNIIAAVDSQSPHSGTTTISTILDEFWKTYGRTFFSRYDYENIDSSKAAKVIQHVTDLAVTQ